MEHAFGADEAFTVGVEEEVLLVDPQTRRLAEVATEVLGRIDLPEELAAHEAYEAEIELRSPPCGTAAEAGEALSRGRASARKAGATLLAVGLHPDAEYGVARLVDKERYRRVRDSMRGLIQRTPEGALHVHVGMPDLESALAAHNGLRAWLPLFAGLTASSPFWFGRDSGLASARSAIIRAFPGRGVPRVLRDESDYEQALADTALGGGPDDYTLVWWDVRLQPRLGTVEVREMDVQSRVGDAVCMAALVRGLARDALEDPPDTAPSEAIAWSVFAATRDGTEAEVLHDGRLAPLREVATDALERARRHSAELGDGEELEGIERIIREGGGAVRQRGAFGERGIDALLDLVLEETSAG